MPDEISVPVLRNDESSLEERMSSNAYNDILPARYLKKNEDGEIIEKQEELFERVAKNIAVAEAVHADIITEEEAPDTIYHDVSRVRDVQKWADKFKHHMEHLKFVPNTPTLINAGTDMQQLSACFVDSPDDDLQDIGDTETEASLIFQSGGGVGYDFGKLRPYGDIVGSTGGIASGPITFMQRYDQNCETIAQGGCVVGDTRIMTDEGYKKISDIHNDTPLNPNGEPLDVAVQTRSGDYHNVMETSDSGSMEVFEIETEGGYTVRGSFDHPVLTVRNGELEYVEIGDISNDDVVVMDQSTSLPDIYAVLDDISEERHFNENEVSLPNALNKDVAFFLGVLWGDGTFDRGEENRIVFSIGKTEREKPIKDRLESILSEWDVNYSVIDQNKKARYGDYWRIEINSKALTDWLKKNNLDKNLDIIPEKLYHSPASIPDFLAGMVCDATYAPDGGVVRYSTISEDFAENLQDLLMLCGVPSKVYSETERQGAYGDNEIFMVETRAGPSTETFDEVIPHPFSEDLAKGGERQNQVPDVDEIVEEVLSNNFDKGCKLPEGVDRKSMKELRRYERGERTPCRQRLEGLFEDVNVDCPEVLNENFWFEPVSSVESVGYQYVYDIEMLHDAHEFVGDNFCVHNVRRGAQMGTMQVTHPDIIHFIHAKNKDVSLAHQLRLNDPDDPTYTDFGEAIEEARGIIDDEGRVPDYLRNAVEGHLSNFNISVTITDDFMEALEKGKEYTLINPRTEEPHIATEETKQMYEWFDLGDEVTIGEELTLPAEKIWTRIVEGAYENGEPGVIYSDTVNEEHSYDIEEYPEYEQTTTNPCAEQPLMEYEACLHGNETLLTDNGIRKIQDFETDKVTSHSGVSEISSVGKLIPQGKKETVTVKLDGEIPIRCTPDHEFKTDEGWVEAKDLIKEDASVQWMENNPLTAPVDMEDADAWRAFSIGWMHGDGWMTENSLGISFNKEDGDFEVKQEVLEHYHDMFGSRKPLKDDGVSYQEQTDAQYAYEKADELGYNYARATERSFPEWFYTASENEQLAFLRGLFTADAGIGGKNNQQVQYATSSYELADEIQKVLGSFGIQSRRYVTEFDDREDQIRVSITKESAKEFMDYIGIETSEKQNQFNYDGDNYTDEEYLDVVSIEEDEPAPVYDLNVPETNQFFTNGVLVHNCNLGHINLSTIVDENAHQWSRFTKSGSSPIEDNVEEFLEKTIDWDEFNERIEVGTRFLDNVVTMSDFPIEEIEETVRKNRKIGLGIMGLAQLYIQLGVEYGSEVGNEIARQLMKHINHESKRVSNQLADERGSFDNWEDSKYANPQKYSDWMEKHVGLPQITEDTPPYPIRNHNTTTIAPTGTTSRIANTTGGCEPIYNVAFYKNVTDDIQGDEMLVVFDSLFIKTLEENDIDPEEIKDYAKELMANNEFDGVDDLVPKIPQELADLFVTTSDLDSKEHAGVLCALQDGVDSSISKTLNAPFEATLDDAKETFEYVYENGGKSVTFYRDGTRTKQVNTTRKDNQDVDDKEEVEGSDVVVTPRERPQNVSGETHRIDTPYGNLYVTINEDEHGPVEMFATVGKSGGQMESFTEALARQVSLSLRAGIHIDEVIDQLENIRSPEVSWDNGETVYSVPDAMALALKRYREDYTSEHDMSEQDMNHTTVVPENFEADEEKTGEECPDCGQMMIYKEGCKECPNPSCGHSKC